MKIHILFFILLLTGLWSCGQKPISSSDNPGALNRYHTYSWVQGTQKAENPLYNSEIVDQNIRQAVDRDLSARGYVIDTLHPDFLVRYQTYTEKNTSTTGGYLYSYPYAGWGWGYGGMWGRGPSTYTTTQGTLILDFIDASNRNILWRGYAEGNVDNAKKLTEKVQKGVQSIMKKFPARSNG